MLGTLVVTDENGQALRLGGPARRRLLAALVARVGSTVTIDTLVDDLWSDLPPATAEKTLQSHVVRLRDDLGRADGSSPVVTEPGGYRLDVAPSSVDAWCFEHDLRAGRQAIAAGDPSTAAPLLDQALAWWRGDAYAEFPDAVFAVSERLRLAELRALGQESRTDVALTLGGGGELVADLETRLRLEPYRERSWEQLMLALYRAGRQGDALSAYRRARRRLVDDLGVEPSVSLSGLERRILDQDPTLLASPVPARAGPPLPPPSPPAPATVMVDDVVTVPDVDPACPYRGLAAYDEDDADVFVGRERLTAELAGRLVDDDVLVVVGPSGAGKSSLIRAGLLPDLRAGAIPGSAVWRSRVLTPSTLDRADIDERPLDLLVLDQAEELFTLTEGEARTDAVRRLVAALASGTRVVLVLRADFYGRLTELGVVTGRIGSATTLVGPLSEQETRRVVVEPAARHGVTVEPALTDQVVADTQGRTGSLPLLSAALERAWEHRTGDRLTLDAYLTGGGVRGALESMAETAYAALGPDEQTAARSVLLRLATLTGGVWTRRPVPLQDALPPGDPLAATALTALAHARLVTVGVSTVELAHEALLGGWPRLRAWLDDRALVADQLDSLASTSSAWERDGRPDADLLRGPRLQAGLDWMSRHPDDLSPREHDYLTASRDAVDATLRTERRRRRTLTAATACLAVAALVATLVGGVAVRARTQADAASLAADARRLAAQSYTAPDIPTAMQLAAAAYALEDSPDTRGALLTSIQRGSGVLFRVRTEHPLLWVGVPTEGGPILVMDDTRTILRVDPATHRVQSAYRVFAGGAPAATSPDGRSLVVAYPEIASSPLGPLGSIFLFDTATGALERDLSDSSVDSARTPPATFTGDGRYLVVLERNTVPTHDYGDVTDIPADTVAVYDAHDSLAMPRKLIGPVEPTGIATSRDRLAISYTDGTVEVRSTVDLRVIDRATLTAPVTGLAISPDGTTLGVVLSSSPTVPQLLTVGRLSSRSVSGQGLAATAGSLHFSPDGKMLSAAAPDGSVLVVSTADASTIASEAGDGHAITATAWGGTRSAPELLSVGVDNQLVSHDLRLVPPTVTVGAGLGPSDGNDARSGDVVVSTQTLADASVRIRAVDLRTGSVTSAWPVPLQEEETLQWLTAAADGTRAALSTEYGGGRAHIRVWDMTTGRVLLDRTQRWVFWDLPLVGALSPDGATLYMTTGSSTIDVVDVTTGRIRRTLTVHLVGPTGSALQPYPVSGAQAGTIAVLGHAPVPTSDDWTVEAGHVLGPLPEPHHTIALLDDTSGTVLASHDIGPSVPTTWGWSPDGTRLALGLRSGGISEYDATSFDQVAGTVDAHSGEVSAVSFSPDGSTLLSTGVDGQVQMWDSASLRRLGVPTQLGALAGVTAWYHADTSIVGTMPSSRTDRRNDTFFSMPGTPAAWLRAACDAAGGPLSPAEWARYVGERTYVTSCPDATS